MGEKARWGGRESEVHAGWGRKVRSHVERCGFLHMKWHMWLIVCHCTVHIVWYLYICQALTSSIVGPVWYLGVWYGSVEL